MSEKKVMVRFPPSPTGPFHIGSVRTALYNYLFAKQNRGDFLLRIEDTDKERSKREYEEDIKESLGWLGLDWSNKGSEWRQSDRTAKYKEAIQKLIKNGAAYLAEMQEGESSEDDSKRVVRFKNPGGKIKFEDLIRGEVEMEVGDLKDFVIAKNVDTPLYHLAVVVDDLESQVTHVIRGEDGLSNTPRQILILEALGGSRPTYAHLPLVLAPDKSKLSKRKHGEQVSLKYYRDLGYEKEALLNFVALIGWNPGTDEEIFSLEDLINKFDLTKVQKGGGVFNIEKLDWINRHWIIQSSDDSKVARLKSQVEKSKLADHEKWKNTLFVDKFLGLILERIHRWGEVQELLDSGEYDYLFGKPDLDVDKITWKTQDKAVAKENLGKVLGILDKKDEVLQLAEEVGKGELLWPLRYALSGRDKSPDPFTLIDIMGIDEARARVEAAINILG